MKLFFFIFLFCLLSLHLSSQTAVSNRDSLPQHHYPWQNDIYSSMGYGYPQGLRGDLGYTFGHTFRLGIIIGTNEYWTSDNEHVSFGFQSSLLFSLSDKSFAFYVTAIAAGKMNILGRSDEYYLIYLGLLYNPESIHHSYRWFNLKLEAGPVYTRKYISGGGIWNPSPVVYDNNMRFAVHLALELNIIEAFNDNF